jgi:C-terminal processing protease CtpA/Prc
VGTVEWLTPDGRRIWHEGIAPDVPVTQPEDADGLTPDDVAAMTEAEIGEMTDAQLGRALQLVATEAIAAN